MKDPDLGKLYAMFRRLGALTQYHGARGEAHVFLDPRGTRTTASYIAKADFENESATIRMSLVKRDGAWQVLEFRGDSPSFLVR